MEGYPLNLIPGGGGSQYKKGVSHVRRNIVDIGFILAIERGSTFTMARALRDECVYTLKS